MATVSQPVTAAPPPTTDEPDAPPRRLVARVFDGDDVVTSILPPERDLDLAIRVAIPERVDVTADGPAIAVPPAPGPTAELEVAVNGAVWERQPAAQQISLSRVRAEQPSSWAVFPFTTPAAGGLVSIDVTVSYRGKPLQAATYVSPVRDGAVPGERPRLTTYQLSGPDEPTDNLRRVDVTLDGRGAEIRRDGDDAVVPLGDVQDLLDTIEDRLSRVLGVPGAPASFDDPRALAILVLLAQQGAALGTHLEPLRIGDARSINVIVNADTRVLPLELVYAGPAPADNAKPCTHVTGTPPAPGTPCTKASVRRVCPYAFWGLHRSIARTVLWEQRRTRAQQPWTTTVSAAHVLYAATVIADDGAQAPLPSDSVLTAAQGFFHPVTRVTNWTAWRRVVRSDRPNLLVVLGHTMRERGDLNLYIGRESVLARFRITASELRAAGAPRPLVLLIACATAALGDVFGTLPGTLTAKGAGSVVATLSKITGPHGAAATTHLLRAVHELAGTDASVGDAVAAARRSLVAERSPLGLVLVSHGEMDTTVER